MTRSLHRNLSLDWHRNLLAEHRLRGNGHWHGDRPRVLLGDEFLAMIDELVFLVLLRVECVWCVLRGSLRHLAFLFKLVVQVINGRVA